jgi:hypothetical protein
MFSGLDIQAGSLSAALICACLCLPAACAPSQEYTEGRGFYSELFLQDDVAAAMREGKVREAGHFSVDASECGIYSHALADKLIVAPTMKDRMLYMGGNAVQHIKATERTDFVLLSVITAPMACGDWTISGDVLYVDRPPSLGTLRPE